MANTTTPGTSELQRLVDDGWRVFRDSVRHIGRARMGDTISGGWTYKDLVAHVAAWEERTARQLKAFREAGAHERLPGGDADAFNARVVESHRLVGPEAILDELDTSHRLLLHELRQVTDGQLQVHEWVGAVVVGATSGHYEEHANELGL